MGPCSGHTAAIMGLLAATSADFPSLCHCPAWHPQCRGTGASGSKLGWRRRWDGPRGKGYSK